MRIAVFGSWRRAGEDPERPLKGTREAFEAACQEIGREIAQRGHSVLVYSDEQATADYHVVQGILNAADSITIDHPLIQVMGQDSSTFSYENEAQDYPDLFSFMGSNANRWQISHLMMTRHADALLVIGGGKGSQTAGLAAFVAGKRVVPVGAFGGGAAQILNAIEQMSAETAAAILSKDDIGSLRGPWTNKQLGNVLQALGLENFPSLMIMHGRSTDWRDLAQHLRNTLNLPDPIIMGMQFGSGLTLPEKFEQLARNVHGAIAVATPDDLGIATLSGLGKLIEESQRTALPRARQNIWVEVGWVWGRLSRNRVLILTRGHVEIPSDLDGIEIYEYQTNPSEATQHIQNFIQMIRRGS